MKIRTAICSMAVALVAAVTAMPAAHADSLLMQRVSQEKSMNLPRKGMTMTQVEHQFGAPTTRLDPRGGDSAKHPVIHRWEYPGYIVYFERSHVVHTVLNTPAGNNTHPTATR